VQLPADRSGGAASPNAKRYHTRKVFHVSPFMTLDFRFHLVIHPAGRTPGSPAGEESEMFNRESVNKSVQRLAKRMVLRTLESFRDGCLEVACPDKTYICGDPASPLRALLVVHDERFFVRMLFGEEVGIGESYMDGDWSSPNPVAVARIGLRNMSRLESETRLSSALSRWRNRVRHWLHRNSLRGSRRNISRHYDLSNAFFRLFLDPTMAYSCGYFQSPADSLEQAQVRKYERVCRKLQLGPSDHQLEIGTGWGGLALYAAENFGCRVTTTTISREQHDFAAELFAGSSRARGQIELLFEDYRSLHGRYDKIASIEMFEAVGFSHYDDFFSACDRLLHPDGSILLQTITVTEQHFPRHVRQCDWTRTHIFPGSELSSVAEILRSLARVTRLSLFHAENIGQHYALTLAAWRERFLGALPQVRALGFDERFIRMWDYYLAICEAAFLERNTSDFQLLLTKNANPRHLYGEPWTGEEPLAREAARNWIPLES
jgi:cyclopropane-fatty-acyl-phospholipid synthase